jgi:hypothetical protein
LRALFRYWNEKRGDLPMPQRAQIDPIEIARLLPVVVMADAAPTGARIRLIGTEATVGYGQEMRGRLVDEMDFGEFTPFWQEAFALVAASAGPAFAAGTFTKGNQHCCVEIALMPLSEDGLRVSQIFGGLLIAPVDQSGMIAPRSAPAYVSRIVDDYEANCSASERCCR